MTRTACTQHLRIAVNILSNIRSTEVTSHVSTNLLSQIVSTTGIFPRGDLEEVVEKNAEFENSDYLKKWSTSQCPVSLLKVLLCYRLQA